MRRLKMAGWEFAAGWILAGVFLVVVLPSACSGLFTPQDQKIACQMNLKQVAQALEMYCAENGGRYPSIPATIGEDCDVPNDSVMMFDGKQMFPDYLNDIAILVCPDDSVGTVSVREDWQVGEDGLPNPCLVDNTSYYYFGWMAPTMDEAGLKTYASAVRTMLNESKSSSYDAHFTVGEQMLCRLSKPPTSCSVAATPPEQIPVFMDNYADDGAIMSFNHIPAGGNVLYLDGHVEFVQYPYFPLQKPLGQFLADL
jgi:prepilin-type processing-associated H-X9-DG protein